MPKGPAGFPCVWLRYNYRLYPTAGQRDALARAFGCARTVWLETCRAHHSRDPVLDQGNAGFVP
ncbi:helix-turn-helix domain-containing protein [Actinomadura sp. 21ATH]|uniref:helix-turn-helix domain-containing protein n=1 Tax=Actinomadura sp. 21ATH TaxID=1735444 RepID=UPI0035C23A48